MDCSFYMIGLCILIIVIIIIIKWKEGIKFPEFIKNAIVPNYTYLNIPSNIPSNIQSENLEIKTITAVPSVTDFPIPAVHSNQNQIVDQITHKVWLGNWESSINHDILRHLGIKMIICICETDKPDNIYKLYSDLGIEHHQFYFHDHPSENIGSVFEKVSELMEKTNAPILVHCFVGASRSPTIVLAYLMRQGMKLEEAFKYVKERRPVVNPNIGFIEQLRAFESRFRPAERNSSGGIFEN